MVRLDEVIGHVGKVGESARRLSSALEYEARETASAMSRLQMEFADQSEGRQAITELYVAMGHMNAANAYLYQMEQHGAFFTSMLRS